MAERKTKLGTIRLKCSLGGDSQRGGGGCNHLKRMKYWISGAKVDNFARMDTHKTMCLLHLRALSISFFLK